MALMLHNDWKNKLLDFVFGTTALPNTGKLYSTQTRFSINTSTQSAPAADGVPTTDSAAPQPTNFTAPVGGIVVLNTSLALGTRSAMTVGTAASFKCGFGGGSFPSHLTGTVGTTGSGADCIIEDAGGGAINITALNWKFDSSGSAKFNTALRDALLNAIFITNSYPITALGVTASSGNFHTKFYTGTPPANVDDAPTGTYVARSAVPWTTAASGGERAFDSYGVAGINSGTIGWARVGDSGYWVDVTVGTTGTEDIVLNSVAATNGSSHTITQGSFTF